MTGKRPTTAQGIVEVLQSLILSGTLAPGSALQEDQLARKLGVSRTPLREAIAYLQGEGLIIDRAHRSSVVFEPSADDLREIYELRIDLETMAVSRAIDRLAPEAIDELVELVEGMDAAETAGAFAELNQRFHYTIHEAAERPRLLSILEVLQSLAQPYVRMLMGPALARGQAEHRQLVDALRQGDREAAVVVTRQHLESTLAAVLPLVPDNRVTTAQLARR